MKRIAAKAMLAALGLCAAHGAQAAAILINFDSVSNTARVNHFYNGGADSLGAIGPALGIDFSDFVAVLALAASSAPRYAYSATGHGLVNVPAGFAAVDFHYGALAPATISVWSGLNGTGSLLGSAVFNGHASAFSPGAIAFAGLGKSLTLLSLPSYAGLDDLRFTLASPVPEPANWGLLLLGGAALLVRRRMP